MLVSFAFSLLFGLIRQGVEELSDTELAAFFLAAEAAWLAAKQFLRRLESTSRLCGARSRLDQRRFSRPNTHFAAFFKIYKKIIFSQAKFAKFL